MKYICSNTSICQRAVRDECSHGRVHDFQWTCKKACDLLGGVHGSTCVDATIKTRQPKPAGSNKTLLDKIIDLEDFYAPNN